MTEEHSTIQAQLRRLRRRFTVGLDLRIGRLEQLWEEVDRHGNVGAIADFYREAHNLAGASGTFGLDRLCAVAQELEQTARGIERGKPAQQVSKQMRQRLRSLRKLLPPPLE